MRDGQKVSGPTDSLKTTTTKTAPTILVSALGALAVLAAFGVLEHFLEASVNEMVALGVLIIFASITATAITFLALRKQWGSYRHRLEEITKREVAENARREAERKYRDIFENAGEGIFQSTPEGQYIAANPKLAQMHGFDSPEELMRERRDLSREAYVDPGRREEFKRLLEANGVVRGFEHQLPRVDGTKIWVSVNARAVRDAHGVIRYYEGAAEEITERKRAEARSAAFASLARKLSGARTQLDAGKIIAETARELFGWDACNLDSYDAERDQIHPVLNVDTIEGQVVDVTPAIADCAPTVRSRRVIELGSQLTLREEPIKFDEDAVPFGDKTRPSASIMTVPVRHASRVIGLFSIQSYSPQTYDEASLRDFEALADHCGEALNRIDAERSLRESEERYRDLVENSREFICTHDLDGLVLSANRAAVDVLGYDPKDYCGKRNFRELLAPEVRDQFDDYLIRIRRDGVASGLMLMQTSSGERRVWEYYNTLRTEGVAVPIVRGMARDVTDQRRAEKAMTALRRELELTMNSMEEGVHRVDLEGKIVFENPAAARMLGWEIDQLLGKPAHPTMHHTRPDGTPYPTGECPIYATFRDGISRQVSDEVFWRQDGTSFPVEYMTAPTRNDRNEIVAAVVTFRDITKRKRAEEALRQSEVRYRELFENAKDAIYVHDLSGRYVSVNRAAEELSGYSREEIIGKHFSNFIVPSCLKDARENLCKKLDNSGETSYEVDIITRDRRRVPVEVVSRMIYENGIPVGIQGTARDITERKRADEARAQYARIVESSDDAIIGKAMDGTILSWNSGAEKIYGYSAREVVGCPITVLVPPDRIYEVPRLLERVRRGESISHYETLRRRKDGKLINVSLTISPIRDARNRIVGISTIARDVTKSKEAEEALKTFSQRLIEAQEAERYSIARELHDEIGQVLTAIRFNLQTVERVCQTNACLPHVNDNIAIVDEALERVRELSLDLRPSLLDDLGLGAALRWYVDRYAKRTGIVAEVVNGFEEKERLSRELETACFRIAQEALTNVARHAQARHVFLELKRGSQQLVLTIRDDGVGFDAKTVGSQASVSKLGLSGMRERARAVRGNIRIESAPNSGTRVFASFPLNRKN